MRTHSQQELNTYVEGYDAGNFNYHVAFIEYSAENYTENSIVHRLRTHVQYSYFPVYTE